MNFFQSRYYENRLSNDDRVNKFLNNLSDYNYGGTYVALDEPIIQKSNFLIRFATNIYDKITSGKHRSYTYIILKYNKDFIKIDDETFLLTYNDHSIWGRNNIIYRYLINNTKLVNIHNDFRTGSAILKGNRIVNFGSKLTHNEAINKIRELEQYKSAYYIYYDYISGPNNIDYHQLTRSFIKKYDAIIPKNDRDITLYY